MSEGSNYWSMTEGVFNCLIDKKRTIAFEKAIKNTVKKGDVVVDMGTGSGVLAMMAAKFGASRIYAVEIDKNNIKTLKNTFKVNGLDEKIIVLEGDVRKISLPEKVDVIIGEMIATGLIEELQIPAMNNILKYAKKNVKVLLNKFENYLDLVYSKDVFYGNKFKVVRYEYPEEKELMSIALSVKKLYRIVDFEKINTDNVIDVLFELKIKKNGLLNGLRISNRTIFFDGSSFEASFAYAYPIILPIEDINVRIGDIIVVKLKYKMCEGFSNLIYKIIKK